MPPLSIDVGLAARGGCPGFDFGRDVLPPGAEVMRSTPAMCSGADGRLTLLPPDQPRFDHDPASGARLGLRLEPAATNLIPQSQPGAAGWTTDFAGAGAAAPVVTPDAAEAPDGSRAAHIAFVRGSGFSRVSVVSAPLAAGQAGVFSIWLRAPAAGASVALRCDVTNGETLTLGPAWRRHALRMTGHGGETSCEILLWSQIAGSPAAAEIEAWGAQLEAGTEPSSLIPSAGSPAARGAETLVLDWASRGVANGARSIRYTFAGGGTAEAVTAIADGTAAVPAPPGGAWLTRAEAL